MTLAIVIAVSMLIGYGCAELRWRSYLKRTERERRHNELKAAYLEKRLWQFISLDEWLAVEDPS